jgi:N-methylhydantoinase A
LLVGVAGLGNQGMGGAMGYRISVDTGGTFTDVVVMGEAGEQTIGKAITTKDRVFNGMRQAIADAAGQLGLSLDSLLAQTDLLMYGTTRATNAIVTSTVARTAMLATQGFPDILVLKEGGKTNPHDFGVDYPKPYIPRRFTYEIEERMSAEGTASVPFNERQAREVLGILKQRRFEAIAVCFLWSIANPAHELRMGELIEEVLPGVPFTLSHKLVSIVREYRRASATAIDASLKPVMQEHLRGLERDLRAAGYSNDILVSTSVGGVMEVGELIEAPIHTVKSGPAMAPIAGMTYSTIESQGDNVIVCDAGGTTFDVGLVRDGRLTHSRDTWLGGQWVGHLLGISSVDVRSIGAGGGSIAWIDEGGLMRVGPQSAGADPGPACYGRGGTQPTVSDAACVLGYFDPAFFLGGRMNLDIDAARAAVGAIATRIGRTVEETAWHVLSLASELMIKAIREITIAEGFNPRESTIVAGGGAAGINIMPIAKELGCDRLILPKVASALSASGMQFADIVKEETASLVTTSNRFNTDGVNRVLSALEDKLKRFLATMGETAPSRHRIEFMTEARYLAQVWELDTPLPFTRIRSRADVETLVEAFHRVHERVLAVRDEGSPVECVNWKARLVVQLAPGVEPAPVAPPRPAPDPGAKRDCFFGGTTAVATPIYKSAELGAGMRIVGPAVIEEPTTTLVVFPGMSAQISSVGNYLLGIS